MNGPWTRLARTQWAPLAALAVLALVAAVLAVTVPSRTADGYDRAAAASLGADGDVRVEARVAGTEGFRSVPTASDMALNSVNWQQLLPSTLRAVVGAPEQSVSTRGDRVPDPSPEPRIVTVSWDDGALKRLRLVAGAPPFNQVSDDSDDDRGREVQIGVSQQVAAKFGYKVGQRLRVGTRRVRITGLYAPVNASDPYWVSRGDMLRWRSGLNGDGVMVHHATALVDAGAYGLLTRADDQLTYTWRFPVRGDALTNERTGAMAADLEAYRAAIKNRSDVFPCEVVTALDARLKSYAGQLRTAKTVLGLAHSGLAAVAAGVLLLAAGLLAERLRPLLATMRARGASLRQLAAPACGLAALAVLPAAALGYGAGRLLGTGPPQAQSVYVIAALVALVLALPAVMIVREHAGVAPAADRREDLAAARTSRRRLVLEALVVVLAVIGVVLLRRRGPAGGDDPLVAAVPVLLGAALGLLVLRVYPYLLRAAGRALKRGRGVVGFLGFARGARQSAIGALPLVVLLLAATVAGFAATVETALQRGQENAAWAAVGADARMAAEQFDPGVLGKVRAVRGVKDAVQARVVNDLRPQSGPARITLIAIDLEAYERIAPGRLPAHPRGALLSPAAARDLGSGPVTLSKPGFDPIRVEPSGRIEDFPGGPGAAFAVVPYRTLKGTQAFPNEVFVRGDPDRAALQAALRASLPPNPAAGGFDQVIEVRRDALKEMTRAPMVDVVNDTFRDATLAGGAFGLLAVLLVLVVGARARGRSIAQLRVLGLSRRQSRNLALVEITPVLLCAVGAGWVLGLLLPGITGPVVDLRPYTGGFAAGNYAVDPAALPALLGALLLAAAAAVAVDRAFDARRDLGGVLRTGE
ncbi:ABC transporter permease [Actinomadura rubrisoli]|uniref:FtsX-like permease family protein n=1 Tax=Actinomadura rubrisoli TaxID=2530368 RepID=A0A4R5B6N5_9ACTN|nr:FtsX-like permease family protein [Actinomadura rubrisoli]TDD80703.1 FtsX-like permease family protein [Actinomadura rubrisoli]